MKTYIKKRDKLPGEEWKDVPGTNGMYQASTAGRIIFERGPRWVLITCSNKQNTIRVNGKMTRIPYVILETFVGPRPAGAWVVHNDGDSQNNTLLNLKWGAPRNNRSARLNEKKVFAMRRAYESGQKSITELADYYMCKYQTVYNVVHYRTWKWIS